MKWSRAYYLLAAFGIVAMLMSLLLNQWMMTLYAQSVQQQHFEKQIAEARRLQLLQYALTVLVVLMAAGAAVYGCKLRRQAESIARAKENHIAALRRSEASLQQRVRERTAELVQSQQRTSQMRQQLLQRVLSAQEDERRRIAQDLHDEIGQALTSVLVGLRGAADAPSLPHVRQRIKDLRRLTVAALEEVQRLARGLRPSVLDDLGLLAALERYAVDYGKANGITVEVQAANGVTPRLPQAIETTLYRIAQEALSNTAKHAGARHARVLLEHQDHCVQMTVTDDGCGIDWSKPDAHQGLGLCGMRERAALLNGSATIRSQPGAGTIITVRVPLEEQKSCPESARYGCSLPMTMQSCAQA